MTNRKKLEVISAILQEGIRIAQEELDMIEMICREGAEDECAVFVDVQCAESSAIKHCLEELEQVSELN